MVLNTVIELGAWRHQELVKLGLGISILAPWIAHRGWKKVLVAMPLGFEGSSSAIGAFSIAAAGG